MKRMWIFAVPAAPVLAMIACGGPIDQVHGFELASLSAPEEAGTPVAESAQEGDAGLTAILSEGTHSAKQSQSIAPMADNHNCPLGCMPMAQGCIAHMLWASCFCPKPTGGFCASSGVWLDGFCWGWWWDDCLRPW